MPSVLYINECSWVGGAERALLDLVVNLDQGRYTPVVVCPEEGELPSMLRDAGIATHIVPFYGLCASNPFRYFETLLRLRSLVRRTRTALIHVNHQYFSNYGIVLGRICRLPVIVHLRGVETDEFFDRFARRMAQADRVICISEAVNARFLAYVTSRMSPKLAKSVAARTSVVYDGLRTVAEPVGRDALCRQFEIDPACRIVGIVGQVVPEKGIRDFIDAAAIVLRECGQVHFLVVGADTCPGRDFAGEMTRYAEGLGIGGSFTFTGFRADAAGLAAAFDVSVLASWQEGLGRVVLESLAVDVPVVATRVGGVPEIIQDGVSGFLVPSRDPKAMAEAVLQVLRMPEAARQAVIARGRESLSRFSIERHTEQMKTVYAQVLSGVSQ